MPVAVRLSPPPGFRPASHFRGFEHPGCGSSIAVVELPGPLHEALRSWTDAELDRRGMKLLSRTQHDGAPLMALAQRTPEGCWLKWVLGREVRDRTVLITAMCPLGLGDELGPALHESLLTAECDFSEPASAPAAPASPVTELTLAAEFNGQCCYTGSGRWPVESPGEPRLVIGHMTWPLPVEQLRDATESRLTHMAGFAVERIIDSRTLQLGDAAGWQAQASGRHVDSQTELLALAATVVQLGEVIACSGWADAGSSDSFLRAARQMIGALRFVPAIEAPH